MRFEDRVKKLFDSVVSHPASDWERLVAESVHDDAVKSEVRRLLGHHEESGGFLSKPAVETFPSMVRALGSQIDEFTIGPKIGGGGYGIVYLAQDNKLDRKVALKVLASGALSSDHAVARFRTEAKAAASLKHPGIVPVYRSGEADGTHFIAYEFVEGETLADRLERLQKTGLPKAIVSSKTPSRSRSKAAETPDDPAAEYIRETLRIIAAVADALEYAHQSSPTKKSVIHRDVKPSNIMLTRDGEPRLTDFGVAKIQANPSITVSGEVAGTYFYMSPEQAKAQRSQIDHRTDIFSLGVVLYECLTLRRPFTGESSHQIVQALTSADPVPIQRLNPAVSRDVETVCNKALEKNAVDRYPTAGHFAADLRCCLADEPILASPPGYGRLAARFGRKYRAPLTAIFVLVLSATTAAFALANLNARRASLGTITVLLGSGEAGAVVRGQRIDEFGVGIGPIIHLGTAPVREARLQPGLYRFSIISANGLFAEFDDFMISGESRVCKAWLREARPEDEGMLRLEGAQYSFVLKDLRTGVPSSHRLMIPSLLVDEAEVSNLEYKQYVEATGNAPPSYWPKSGFDQAMNDLPVVGVSHSQALAYALWRGKRLPTIAEWMAAAQAPDGRLYPWGSEPAPIEAVPSADALREQQDVSESGVVKAYLRRSAPVRSNEALRTPLGLYHMYGNVGELTGTVFQNSTSRAIVVAFARTNWLSDPRYCDLSDSGSQPYGTDSQRIGFRCVRDLSPTIGVGNP